MVIKKNNFLDLYMGWSYTSSCAYEYLKMARACLRDKMYVFEATKKCNLIGNTHRVTLGNEDEA